jgi:hypothetical protein
MRMTWVFLWVLSMAMAHVSASSSSTGPPAPCTAGRYLSGSICEFCPPGYYQPDNNAATSCIACAAGSYASSTGATSCTNCTIQSFAPAASSGCMYCATALSSGMAECPPPEVVQSDKTDQTALIVIGCIGGVMLVAVTVALLLDKPKPGSAYMRVSQKK